MPFRWKLLPEHRANLVHIPSFPAPPPTCAPSCFASLRCRLSSVFTGRSPTSARELHYYCRCGNERFDFPHAKKVKDAVLFFRSCFFPPCLSPISITNTSLTTRGGDSMLQVFCSLVPASSQLLHFAEPLSVGCQVETDETGGNPAPSVFDKKPSYKTTRNARSLLDWPVTTGPRKRPCLRCASLFTQLQNMIGLTTVALRALPWVGRDPPGAT